MNLTKYFQRIGVDPVSVADLQTLRLLHRAHLHAVPFENLDIRRGRPLALDEQTLFAKLVERKRGGICYEQNVLFASVLRALGYEVQLLSAEVSRDEGGYGPPFDHMALLVTVGQQRLLADVGFGDSFLEPLLLDRDAAPTPALGGYEVCCDGPWCWVSKQGLDGNTPEPQYRFQTVAREVSDFDAMLVHHQSSPASHFTRKDICTRATESGLITLSDDQLIETSQGVRRITPLADAAQRRQALEAHFGVVL